MILSQLYFAKVSEFGGDYFFGGGPNQKSDTFFGGGFEGFFFSIFSLDKMIKNWRAYFSNDLKPPTKHRVFSQSSDLQKPCGNLSNETRAPELFAQFYGLFRGKNGSFPQVFADLTFLTSMYNQWTLQRHQRMTQTRSALESMNIPKTLIQWLWLIFVSEIYWWMIFDHPYFDRSCRKLEAKKIPVLNWRMLMIRLYNMYSLVLIEWRHWRSLKCWHTIMSSDILDIFQVLLPLRRVQACQTYATWMTESPLDPTRNSELFDLRSGTCRRNGEPRIVSKIWHRNCKKKWSLLLAMRGIRFF